jgi:hypothetical protein
MEHTFLTYLITLLQQMPVILQVALLVFAAPSLFTLYRFLTKEEFRNDVISLVKNIPKPERNKVDKKLIQNHPLLTSLPQFIMYIKNINMQDTEKDAICDIILRNKAISVIKHTKEFLANEDNLKLDSENLQNEMLRVTNNIVVKYEVDIQKGLLERYKDKKLADELFQLLYINGFSEYHKHNIQMIMRFIEFQNTSTLGNIYKIYSFLNILKSATLVAIFDCERVLLDCNGQIKKLINEWQSRTLN